ACNGGTGSATITATGGTPSYSYDWSNGATTSAVSGLMAGVYTATVTDANSCTSIKNVTITQPSALSTSTAVTNAACNGGTGSATVTATGGAGSYTYDWSNGATTANITALAGFYTATVTDANACTSIESVNISQPTALATSTAVTHVLCNGGTGSATITATGGTPSYSYDWSNGATTSAVSGLMAGVYTATVTDANSCTSIKNVTITQPSALSTSTAAANALCNGGTGSATVTATGGAGAYSYDWSNGATTSVVSGLMAGAYTATVTDANNCTSIENITISQPAAMVTTTAATSALCNGATGSATVSATGGAGSYTYDWSNGSTTANMTALAGVYTATVTDANACTSVKSVVITEPSALTATTSQTNVTCNAGTNGSASVSASVATSPYSY